MKILIEDNEVAIEGSVDELNHVAQHVKNSKLGETKYFLLSNKSDPHPYRAALKKLVLKCNASKVKGTIENDSLVLEYREDLTDIVASYFEFEDGSACGAHCHFDKIGNEAYFDDSSANMIVGISRDR